MAYCRVKLTINKLVLVLYTSLVKFIINKILLLI